MPDTIPKITEGWFCDDCGRHLYIAGTHAGREGGVCPCRSMRWVRFVDSSIGATRSTDGIITELRHHAADLSLAPDDPPDVLEIAAERIEELSSALQQIPDLLDSMRYAAPEMFGFWMNEILKRAHVADEESA